MEGAPPAYTLINKPAQTPQYNGYNGYNGYNEYNRHNGYMGYNGYNLGWYNGPSYMQIQTTPQINHRFPREFGFYNASDYSSDLTIALHANDQILWYISTHGSFSNQANVVLHSFPNSSAPPLATADFHHVSSTIDITLFTQQVVQMLKLEDAALFSSCKTFQVRLAYTNQVETFEWKNSRGNEVAMLNGSSQGMKLVHKNSGQVVAVWAMANMAMNKWGKMAFLAQDRAALGEDFELTAVTTILAIMTKERKKQENEVAKHIISAITGMPF